MKSFFRFLLHPLFALVALSLLIHVINVFQYDIFPEKDSYGWILQYENAFANHSLNLYRPFFAALVYFLHSFSGLSVGQIFKYVLPFFSVIVLFPLWMMAKTIPRLQWQMLFLGFSLVSPTVIFQMESIRPQIMVVCFLYFLLGMTFYFRFQKSVFFDFILGSLLLLGIFFHSGFGILFLLWVISMIWLHWRWCWQRKQLVMLGASGFILGVFTLFQFAQMSGYLNFIPELVKSLVINFFSLNTNFLYPMVYVNSDGVPMGWPGLIGVIKFYAFYVGPLVFFSVATIFFLYINSKSARSFFLDHFRERRFFFIYFSIGIFFLVTEIFPRFFNIALLPDRIWTFLAILLLLPLFFLIVFIEKRILPLWQERLLFLVLFFSICANIIGAGYVNNQFQYISSPEEMKAFQWIQDRLPSNRIVFHFGYGDLLAYHSKSEVYELPKDFLQELIQDYSSGDTPLCHIRNDIEQDMRSVNDVLAQLSSELNQEKTKRLLSNSASEVDLRARISQLSNDSVQIGEVLDNIESICQRPLYVYVSYSQEKNPFRGRAYDTGFSFGTEQETVKTLNRYPDFLKLVFQNDRVFIWEVIGDAR